MRLWELELQHTPLYQPASQRRREFGGKVFHLGTVLGAHFRLLFKPSTFHLHEPPLDCTMIWRMGPSFTMLLALWLVCGSEPHLQARNRVSHGGRKAPLVSPTNRRPARLLRHTGRSQGIDRTTLGEPNLQSLQRRRSIPVLRVAHATALPASLGISGAPVRTSSRTSSPELSPSDGPR